MSKKSRKIRKKVAKELSNKLAYICTCPNERDIIMNVVLARKDKYAWTTHCPCDCLNTFCECHPHYVKKEEMR